MIKYVKKTIPTEDRVKSIDIDYDNAIKYIGQSGTSGYACAAKGYIADYVLRGIPISWVPLIFDNSHNDYAYYVDSLCAGSINKRYNKYNRLIIHSTPDIWKKYIDKKIDEIIGYCTWETNMLPETWVDYINQLPEVWVPSTFNEETFVSSGVKSKIKVVPHIWHPQPLLNKRNIKIYDYCRTKVSNDRFTFYSIGELNFRKGIEDLVKVFDKFQDEHKDTQLILKLHYKLHDENGRKHCIDKLSSITNKLGKSIFLILDNLNRDDIVALHSFGDCYVSLNKGEGFGLTVFDAYKFGKKVITTGYGGQVDFLGNNHEGLVEYKIKKVSRMEAFSNNYSVDQEWAHPNLDHAYELMEKMFYANKL